MYNKIGGTSSENIYFDSFVYITLLNTSRSVIALPHSCQCHYQVYKSWEHKEKLLVVGIQTYLLESVP